MRSLQKAWIVASRGRNPENPSNRNPGIHLEQRLEINLSGLCNTITSVQKDNMVLEIYGDESNNNRQLYGKQS